MDLVGREWIAIRSVLSLHAHSGLEFDNAWSESTSRLVGNSRSCVDMLFVRPINDPLAIAGQALSAASKSIVRMDCGCVFLGVPRSFAFGDLFSNVADPAGVVGLDQANDHGIWYARLLYGDVHGVCQIHSAGLAVAREKIVSLAHLKAMQRPHQDLFGTHSIVVRQVRVRKRNAAFLRRYLGHGVVETNKNGGLWTPGDLAWFVYRPSLDKRESYP